MAELDSFGGSRVWVFGDVEAFSFVPDDDRDFVGPTTTANVNVLPRVLMIAVNHGIRQRLAQCDFDILLVPRDPLASPDQSHESVDEGWDCSNFASQRQLQPHVTPARFPLPGPPPFNHLLLPPPSDPP